MGCHSCELACAVAHGDGHDIMSAVAAHLPLHARNHVVSVDGATMPMQCRQCEDAPCASICPTGACKQADGQVQIDEQHCIGCKLCVMVCPFGVIEVCSETVLAAPSLTNHGVAKKCDVCVDWRATTGSTDRPASRLVPRRLSSWSISMPIACALRLNRAREVAQSNRHMHF